MWIDSNAYIGHWPFRTRKYNTCHGLIERMDEFGVSQSMVSHLSAVFLKNTQPANESLYREIQAEKSWTNRLYPVATINPIYSGWKEDYMKCIQDWEMKAIKLFPIYHKYDFYNEHCIELVKMAARDNVLVMIPFRIVDPRPSSWLDVEEVVTLSMALKLVKEVPQAKYIFQNVASSLSLDEDEKPIWKENQVWMDTSGRSMNTLPSLVQEYGARKFVMGSHSPTLDYCTGLLRIETLYPTEANEQEKQAIRAGNLQNLINI